MAGRSAQKQEDDAPGAPEWMVTFSDCMTLLLTFFVLLLSFSSFDDKVFRKLDKSFGDALPSVSPLIRKDRDSFFGPPLEIPLITYVQEPDSGSEKPTLQDGTKNSFREATEPKDFYNRKVFVIPSEQMFWATGVSICAAGRETLKDLALFLRQAPSRVVISENGRGQEKADTDFGLRRAWAVAEHLVQRERLAAG